MKIVIIPIFLGCILMITGSAQALLNPSKMYQSARRNYHTMRPIQGTQPVRDAKKRFLTTGTEQEQKRSAMHFEQPLRVTSSQSISGVSQQEKNGFLNRVQSWWYGSKPSQKSLVLPEYRVSQMFNYVLSEMNTFRKDLLISKSGQESVFEQENKWLRPAMANLVKKLNEEYRDVLQGEKDGYSIAGPVLLFIYDYLTIAVQHGKLGDRLVLAYVFSACDLLQKLRSLGVELAKNDKNIVHSITNIVNEYLMMNPDLISCLEGFNAISEPNKRLSDLEMHMIINNSALLVPIDEVQSLKEILSSVYGISPEFSTSGLYELLKKIGVKKNAPIIALWNQANIFRRTNQKTQQEISNEVILSFGITDRYAAALRQLLSPDYAGVRRLNEIALNAYSKEGRSIEAYVNNILKDRSAQERDAEVHNKIEQLNEKQRQLRKVDVKKPDIRFAIEKE